MSPEQQRICIAEACGWKPSETWAVVRTETHCVYRRGDELRTTQELPNYLHDLNAMHGAWGLLDQDKRDVFRLELLKRTTNGLWLSGYHLDLYGNATAAQRAEAFLKAIGKWEES